MRKLPATLTFLVAQVLAAHGQVSVEVSVDQDQYLRDEAVVVKVRVTNRSGQLLHLGADNDWLSLNVDHAGGTPVGRVGPVPVKGEFDLESAQMATRTVDLQPWFEISETGRYTVTATVRIRQWEREVASRPRAFEVVRGTRLWDQEIGVPGGPSAPEVRRFILQQANYRKQLKLYARISNSTDSYAYRVIQLGPVVSFGRPEAQVDRNSHWHILFQTGPRSFSYSELDPSGVMLSRRIYDYTTSRPSLRLQDGGIVVAGGARRVTASDLPTFEPPVTTNKDVAPRPN